MRTEQLRSAAHFKLVRTGRFLIAELLTPHRVLSTSSRNGGQSDAVRYLVNHQSCEGADHRERASVILGMGLEGYHDAACGEIGLDPAEVALMGTAANMNYAAVVERGDGDVSAAAIVTAGVQGNAACAGDPATWRETPGVKTDDHHHGTINTMLLIDRPLTTGAQARAAMTMTEAKTAALLQLAVRSKYSRELATGTGTDQYCIACPLTDEAPFTNTGAHSKLGELIGVVVREATLEALRWQNGLELSITRNLFHALGRHGLEESRFWELAADSLSERQLALLRKNKESVFHEPLVAAAAYAFASILDRVRYGTLPPSASHEALRQQAAAIAANLAAQPDRWSEFCARLGDVDPLQPERLIVAAIALGWTSKWT